MSNVIKIEDYLPLKGGLRMVGSSFSMQQVYPLMHQVASTRATVLITGETGTGKELVAREIHRMSGRDNFVAVNCAGIPADLVESELFGHAKGAFTGAYFQTHGLFQQADYGTLFLDEVASMDPRMQAKILRALEDGVVTPVGSMTSKKVDARIIAATNKSLEGLVRSGSFREDLLYRLNVFPINVPPLRDRMEDIPELVQHFLQIYSDLYKRSITSIERGAFHKLYMHRWPGNVRELEHLMERCILLSNGDYTLSEELIAAQIYGGNGRAQSAAHNSLLRAYAALDNLAGGNREAAGLRPPFSSEERKKLTYLEMQGNVHRDMFAKVILEVLNLFRGNVELTASSIGLNPEAIRGLLKSAGSNGIIGKQ